VDSLCGRSDRPVELSGSSVQLSDRPVEESDRLVRLFGEPVQLFGGVSEAFGCAVRRKCMGCVIVSIRVGGRN